MSERQELAARVATRMIQADEYARHKAWAQCAAFLYDALKAAIEIVGTYEEHEPAPGPYGPETTMGELVGVFEGGVTLAPDPTGGWLAARGLAVAYGATPWEALNGVVGS